MQKISYPLVVHTCKLTAANDFIQVFIEKKKNKQLKEKYHEKWVVCMRVWSLKNSFNVTFDGRIGEKWVILLKTMRAT